MGGQGDTSPLFEVEGTPCVLSLLRFGGRHFCTNAHGCYWMIGAIFVKFTQLILMKIIKTVATRIDQMSDFKAKMHQTQFRVYSAPPDP